MTLLEQAMFTANALRNAATLLRSGSDAFAVAFALDSHADDLKTAAEREAPDATA